MKLKGRYALITGGSQGLGKAMAQAFLREGASVAICARGRALLKQTVQELAHQVRDGQTLMAERADVSKPKQVDQLVKRVLKRFPHLDILVNNAAVYGPKGLLEQVDWGEWVHTVGINLMGTVYMCRALLRHFRKRGYGKILIVAGGGASYPFPRFSAYAASKAAIVRFAETLAEELKGSAICVNAVAPGPLNTRFLSEVLDAGPDRVGAGFYAKAKKQQEEGGVSLEQAAQLCVFLASSASDRISGRLISAVWDPWEQLPEHAQELTGSDVYTLRRILPKDRGLGWEKR